MEDRELEALLANMESDRVERKAAPSSPERLREAICAFANDLPDHRAPGVLFVGVNDDGTCANLAITDDLLLQLSSIRSDGNILPLPSMSVQKRTLSGCTLAAIVVEPSDDPPVRFKGRTWIRVGPRRAVATREEERRLSEKRRHKDLHYDLRPVRLATSDDLDLTLFSGTYLPAAIAPDILAMNQRTAAEQLAALRFIDGDGTPTVLGLLTIGANPRSFLPGAYVQFLRLDGPDLTDAIRDQKEISGPLTDVMRQVDDLLRLNISVSADITSGAAEIRHPEYPIVALRQLVGNAIMHRSYEDTNAPVRVYWFSDRIEISNPGGPFGQVTRANFGRPGVTDYRNPHVAEAMKNLGYVQRFGVGIALARAELARNGNSAPEFQPEDSYMLAVVRRRP
jgi:ATP-dependent DNA helicase RecG